MFTFLKNYKKKLLNNWFANSQHYFNFILLKLLLCFVLQDILTGQAYSKDLSTMSDFFHESAVIVQDGNLNRASIFQAIDLDGNIGIYAEINQEGSDNYALITQTGENNSTRINQISNSNYTNVSQDGVANSANILQANSYNTLYATQAGDNNNILLTQSGSAIATLLEAGKNNVINGAQSFGSTMNVNMVGNNQTATVRQN